MEPGERLLADRPRYAVPVDLLDRPARLRGELHRAHGDPVGLDVVGVAVSAVLVIGDEDLGTHLQDHLDEMAGRLVDVGPPEAVRVVVVGGAHHPGVLVPAAAAEETEVLDAQSLHGRGQLALTLLSEAGAGQMPELRRDDLATLAEGAGDQGHPGALCRVPGHGRAVVDRLVVRVRVHQEKTPSGLFRHGPTLRGATDSPAQPGRRSGVRT